MSELEKYDKLEKLKQLVENGVLTQAEFDEQKAKILETSSSITKVSPKEPTKPISEQLAPVFLWIQQNKKLVMLGGGVFLAGLLIFKFFIQHNPAQDGQKAAKTLCNCRAEYNKSSLKAYQSFLDGFEKSGIKTESEAQQKLTSIMNEQVVPIGQCEEKANTFYNNQKESYLFDNKQLDEFERAYKAQKELCSPEKEYEREQLFGQVNSKIMALAQTSKEGIIAQIKERYTIIFNGKYETQNHTHEDPNTGVAGACAVDYFTDKNGNLVRINYYSGGNTSTEFYFWEGQLFFVFHKWELLENVEEYRYYFKGNDPILCKEKIGSGGNNEEVTCNMEKVNTIIQNADKLKKLYYERSFDNDFCL